MEFNRVIFIAQLQQVTNWDVIIIGGGATGLGTALDAASRGFRTLLLEQADFAKGTSSRSTKLVHGGVRYLAQGNIALVKEALYERGLMLKNAPHIVKKQSFVIPCYNWIAVAKYLIGLKLYDFLAGKLGFGRSVFLSKSKLKSLLPNVNETGLKGGIAYFDGQFDDARLAINIAQTCAKKGGVLLNYFKVTGLIKNKNGQINGLNAVNMENQQQYQVHGKAIINATGVFVDDILLMDTAIAKPLVRPSQGVHVVLNKSFFPGNTALMIPKTSDGRVLFVVPWHEHLLVGTTDTPLKNHVLEPRALEEEIDFILQTAGNYLNTKPLRADLLSVFAGLRPLAATHGDSGKTKEISRSHKIIVSASGLITVTGGKWTTYRKMAEDTVNKAIRTAKLDKAACVTANLPIHGARQPDGNDPLNIYGTDAAGITFLIGTNKEWANLLHHRLPYMEAEVVWAVRNEMAITVEDILARRLRALFLDALAAIDMAPKVAEIMAAELNYGQDWQQNQIATFTALAKAYLPDLSEKTR
ncbi:MAG: glycerol-3-phosphate dehydrogenase/oxidase [Sphingobacteriaceae bacterium]